jgi:hypothetical protein
VSKTVVGRRSLVKIKVKKALTAEHAEIAEKSLAMSYSPRLFAVAKYLWNASLCVLGDLSG